MKTLSAFFAFCFSLSAFGQALVKSAAFNGAAYLQGMPVTTSSGFYPTNVPGNIAYAYWTADNFTTNGSTITCSNQMGAWSDLTGTKSTSPVSQVNAISNYPGLWIKHAGVNPFKAAYSISLPVEVMMVCAVTNWGANIIQYFSGTNGTSPSTNNVGVQGIFSVPSYRTLNSGPNGTTSGGDLTCGPITNKYILIDMVATTTNSQVYTNGVLVGTFGAGPGTSGKSDGYSLALHPYFNYTLEASWMMSVILTNTLTSDQRASVWSAIQNKYGL